MEANYEYRYQHWGEGRWEPVYVDVENDDFYRGTNGDWDKNISPWSYLVEDPECDIRPIYSDNVNSPSHYGQGSIECIDYIKDFLTTEEYIGYLRGNIAKYMHRFRYKGKPIEDLHKADWYKARLNEVMEEQEI